MSSPSMAVGSPRGAPPINGAPMNGANGMEPTNQLPPPVVDEEATSNNPKLRKAKLAQLAKIRNTIETPANGAVMPHPGPAYPNAQPTAYPPPYGCAQPPPGMVPGMRPPPVGYMFQTPQGPCVMTPDGPVPLHIMQRHHMQMQQAAAQAQQVG